jgi:hypothetical protein
LELSENFLSVPFEWIRSNRDVYAGVIAGIRLPKPENMPESLFQLAQKCSHDDPNQRPDFKQILSETRDIMGLIEPEYSQNYSQGNT